MEDRPDHKTVICTSHPGSEGAPRARELSMIASKISQAGNQEAKNPSPASFPKRPEGEIHSLHIPEDLYPH
ncbi:hypothetical protein DSO57_1004812 [Entomophthora muscae]|uniref:Uncharacterized protein n=1 Tax=Entomophthora muscae TaxID=34485 RepID=A0ACC2RN20_9FUNG|nr:hypothetical protein DSO57_1004812 [Entomophthora muscae]